MTTKHYLGVIEDLAIQLPSQERYQRLLHAIRQAIPCDAIALLKLNRDSLEPLAFQGLSPETLGRRFKIGQHPRLDQILSSHHLVRFDTDSSLPDPYDGLIDTPDHELHVHDCMGISIHINNQPWGVITLDALRPGQFDDVDPQQQQAAIALTRSVITAVERINLLEQQLSHGHDVTAELNRDQGGKEVIGNSPAITQLLKDIDTVAPTPLTVLIQGETGVGKENIAHRLHLQSNRVNQPLVQINCAALPEALAEAELFGHTKGAFTGADSERSGRFELADGGTLFLDEIGELPLPTQAKLLRALQEGEIQRAGSDHPIQVDVRIIAATNRDLKEEVKAGRFRADLYHRISVYPVTVPPLRERGNDVLMLAEFFLERDQHRLNLRKLTLDRTAKRALMAHTWPGNVRELEHLLSRAALKASSQHYPGFKSGSTAKAIVTIQPAHLGLEPSLTPEVQELHTQPALIPEKSLREATEDFQRDQILQALVRTQRNVSAAARLLKVDRSNLLRLIKRLEV
ncbi:nitric oxide reductase transcriptional regulator NorR [Pseudomaricurvus sp.]|uniref:nitric oxide reductase transcriptional regulator NorR n=1 Tax=Pseudomaricurvus sp. TaxID=2004510 RepID=UPI003F6BC7A9